MGDRPRDDGGRTVYVHYICARRAEFSVPRLRDMEILVQKHIFRIFHEIQKFRKILHENIFSGKFMTENGFSEKFGNFGSKLVFPCNLGDFGQSRVIRINPCRQLRSLVIGYELILKSFWGQAE